MEWFQSWFDSPYYHILYAHRDDAEASNFLLKLIHFLEIKTGDTVLDLGCGKGRHSMYLASQGMDVVGMDLSPNSIERARIESSKNEYRFQPSFTVGDMRDFTLNMKFQYVFNLFTSFGYFDDIAENEKVIAQVGSHQASNGVLLIDYFNSVKVLHKGEESYTKIIDGVEFQIHKFFEDNKVKKNITVTHVAEKLHFQESVQLFEKEQIEDILRKNGYEVTHHFGSYQLEDYTFDSDRSILIAKKK